MQLKNTLAKKFARVASRAALAAVLTIGAMTPSINVYAQQQPLPEPQTSATLVAASAQTPVTAEVQFSMVKDLDTLVQEYPFVSNFRDLLRQADADLLESLKENKEEASFTPGTFEIGTYKDAVNGREFIFLHAFNSPNLCSAEGCSLAIFMKDSKDFRQVGHVRTDVPIEVISTKDDIVVKVPGSLLPGYEVRYNAATDKFDFTTPAKDAKTVPAPQAPVAPK